MSQNRRGSGRLSEGMLVDASQGKMPEPGTRTFPAKLPRTYFAWLIPGGVGCG
jgi:hypothetical protein